MSKNFLQIKQAISQWLGVDQEDGDERLPAAICGDLANWVIREYCRNRESRFGEFTRVLPTVIGTSTYTLPTDWSKPRKVWYVDPVTLSPKVIGQLNKDIFDVTYPTAATDPDPTHYTIWNDTIRFGKAPSRVINILLDYYRILPDLVADDDTNRMTLAADQYIIMKALVGASAFGVEDNRMPTWEALANKLEMALDSEDSRRHQTGRRSQSEEPG